jgi:hypothetical protein
MQTADSEVCRTPPVLMTFKVFALPGDVLELTLSTLGCACRGAFLGVDAKSQ